jgi:hypothetical protein
LLSCGDIYAGDDGRARGNIAEAGTRQEVYSVTENNTPVRLRPAPLPASVDEMLARKTMRAMTLNDYVDQIHVVLFAQNAEYGKLLDAVYDEDAVEGSLSIDNMLAAELIRKYASRNEVHYVSGKKLATIVKSLNIVLRRYHISRKERSLSIGGQPVNEID